MDPVVKTEQGEVRGKTATDYLGGTFFSFQGIPYAKPPVGSLRFKAPQPPEKWTGIRDATKEGSQCYSSDIIKMKLAGSEDCLFLNVFTPELPTDAPLKPVMVWIHGGGFIYGSANTDLYGPDFLITEDVVLVTTNYRTGVLGFLCLDDPSLGVIGNAGLKDQVMALRWVQENIRYFNGDPGNVTIFGESAGGASVHFLMMSPMAKGIFHKAIAQSGCALNLWTMGENDSKKLAEVLDFKSNDEKEMLAFLQSVPVEKLYEAQMKIKDNFRADMVRPVGPSIEKTSPFEPSFLSEDPFHTISQGKYNKVPLLIGYNSHEGMLWEFSDSTKGRFLTDFEEAIPYVLKLQKGTEISKATAKEIKQFYYGDQEPSLENQDCVYRLHTDNMFFREIHTSARLHATTSEEPVYFYRFSFDGKLNFFKKLVAVTYQGACHGDELGYLFHNATTTEIDLKSVEANVIRQMTTLWANFARRGNPNPNKSDSVIDVTWKPVTKDNMHFLDIDTSLTCGVNPDSERVEFWSKIFKR